ncbi:MAG: two-component sensor histidine kinase [Actinobacteria bacterium]|nr:two-component sensor histidine kinase [Actinomycetota bacterium]
MNWFLLGLSVGGAAGALVAVRFWSRRAVDGIVASPAITETVTPPGDAAGLHRSLEALPIGVVAFHADGSVLARNSRADAATGVRHADLLVESTIDRLARAARSGAVAQEQVTLVGPPPRVFAVRAVPVADGGAVVSVEDVTERHRLDAVRTDFVANVSHELRTPVGAVSVLAETLEGEVQDETLLRLVRRMQNETARMTRTIDDLLELSRIEMGGEILVGRVDLAEVARETVDRYADLARAGGVSVAVRSIEGDATVNGDSHQLASVVGNLVENAIKYSTEGGRVLVTVIPSVDRVDVEVHDQGIGIPAASLDRIFERFYRIDKARSRVTGGTGLGLSIVRNIVTNHGGEVNVTSREGEGSIFTVSLPRNGRVLGDILDRDERGPDSDGARG